MNRLVFLLEERSMKVLLEDLLPRLFPGLDFVCVTHEGKQDLEKSIPRKLRAWREPGVRFMVIRDNDGGDCRALKRRILGLCVEGGRSDTIVRIACQELEAWYLGDPEALVEAFGHESLRRISDKAKYRNPDEVQVPSHELAGLIPEFQKGSGARRMAVTLRREGNTSRSYQAFLEGVEKSGEKQWP